METIACLISRILRIEISDQFSRYIRVSRRAERIFETLLGSTSGEEFRPSGTRCSV